jgi:hypothetical protein
MTAEEFTAKRKALWPKSTYKAAKALGVRQGAIIHWQQGQRKVPRYVEIILKCIEENADTA